MSQFSTDKEEEETFKNTDFEFADFDGVHNAAEITAGRVFVVLSVGSCDFFSLYSSSALKNSSSSLWRSSGISVAQNWCLISSSVATSTIG